MRSSLITALAVMALLIACQKKEAAVSADPAEIQIRVAPQARISTDIADGPTAPAFLPGVPGAPPIPMAPTPPPKRNELFEKIAVEDLERRSYEPEELARARQFNDDMEKAAAEWKKQPPPQPPPPTEPVFALKNSAIASSVELLDDDLRRCRTGARCNPVYVVEMERMKRNMQNMPGMQK